MKEELTKIEELIGNFENIEKSKIKEIMQKLFSKLSNRLENYVGDYPTFIEPVYLEDNVKIGDDVLIGPNVYIGANSEIPDYVELSNTVIFENVIIGENFKLENCIVAKNSCFNFKNMSMKNSLLIGETSSKDELQSKQF